MYWYYLNQYFILFYFSKEEKLVGNTTLKPELYSGPHVLQGLLLPMFLLSQWKVCRANVWGKSVPTRLLIKSATDPQIPATRDCLGLCPRYVLPTDILAKAKGNRAGVRWRVWKYRLVCPGDHMCMRPMAWWDWTKVRKRSREWAVDQGQGAGSVSPHILAQYSLKSKILNSNLAFNLYAQR